MTKHNVKSKSIIVALLASPSILIFLVHLLINGWLLLNFSSYWDGMILDYHLLNGEWDVIKNWFFEAGLHPQAYLHFTVSLLFKNTSVFGHMLFSFFAVFGISKVLFEVLHKSFLFSKDISLLASLLYLVFPVYSVLFSTVHFFHITSQFIFVFAYYLQFRFSMNTKDWKWLSVSYLFLFLSFFHNSLLTLNYSFLFGLVICNFLKSKKLSQSLFTNYLFLSLLPFIFFAMKIMLFSPYGLYENYNQISFDLESAAKSLLAASWFLMSAPYTMLMVVPLLGLVIANIHNWRKQRRAFYVFLFAIGNFLLSALPYAAVGKMPLWSDWSSRHGLLFGITYALLGLALFLYFSSRRILLFLSAGLILSFSYINSLERYLMVITRGAKDQYITSQLKKMSPPPAHSTIIWIDDWKTIDPYFSKWYRSYEINYILSSAFGSQKWSGISTEEYSKNNDFDRSPFSSPIHKRKHFLEAFKGGGCLYQLEINIKRKKIRLKALISIVSKILYNRIFNKENSEIFDDLLSLHLIKLEC